MWRSLSPEDLDAMARVGGDHVHDLWGSSRTGFLWLEIPSLRGFATTDRCPTRKFEMPRRGPSSHKRGLPTAPSARSRAGFGDENRSFGVS